MALLAILLMVGTLVFLAGLLIRSRKAIFIGSPAAVLMLAWFVLASWPPNPQKEFDRLFGAKQRRLASDIRTIKPTLMDGYFISFRMQKTDFDAQLRPQFGETTLEPNQFLRRQSLPTGWPDRIKGATSVLYSERSDGQVYLLYFPEQEMAYASVAFVYW